MANENNPPDSTKLPGISDEDIVEVVEIASDDEEFQEIVGDEAVDVMEASDEELNANSDEDSVSSSSDNDHQFDLPQVTPERDDSILTFTGHEEPKKRGKYFNTTTVLDAVLSCSFHPLNPNVAVTGGMDEKVIFWEIQLDEQEKAVAAKILKIGKEPLESVDWVAFSFNGKYLAAVDLTSTVNIYNGNTYEHCHTFQLKENFQWFEWHQKTPAFCIGTSDSIITYLVSKDRTKYLPNVSNQMTQCGVILPDGTRLAIGTTDGVVNIYDMKSATIEKTIKLFHEEPQDVIAIDCHSTNRQIICGCKKGAIFTVNTDSGKFSMFPNVTRRSEYVEVVSYAKVENPLTLALSGHSNGIIRIWDHVRQQVRHEITLGANVTSARWHPSEFIVFCTMSNGRAYMLDARSGSKLKEFQGHTQMLLSMDVNMNFKQGPALLSTSYDKTAKLYLLT